MGMNLPSVGSLIPGVKNSLDPAGLFIAKKQGGVLNTYFRNATDPYGFFINNPTSPNPLMPKPAQATPPTATPGSSLYGGTPTSTVTTSSAEDAAADLRRRVLSSAGSDLLTDTPGSAASRALLSGGATS